MELAFLGGVFTKDDEHEILLKSKGNVQIAANVLQWNIINGIEQNTNNAITIINSLLVGSFPKCYKDAFIESKKWSHREGALNINIGYLNIIVIKHLWRAFGLGKALLRWVNKNNEEKTVITYSVYLPFILAVKIAKAINSRFKACLVVPDLPEFTTLQQDVSLLYKCLKRGDIFITRKCLDSFDCYVLLTEYMAEKLPVRDKPYIVIEGIANENKNVTDSVRPANALLYTGTLNRSYGIINLLKAFDLIEDKQCELWICGEGEAEPDIRSIMQMNDRLKYFGLIPHDEVMKLQRKARILINPRNNEMEFTRYSFPSKNMEYLLSGRPLIAYKLAGIPNEYDKYIYYIDGNSPSDMAETINQVLSKGDSELDEFGGKARNFVLLNKNQRVQAKKILEMVMHY